MSEMVERVALAISGSDDPAQILSIHRKRARLAIVAMREPTPKMIARAEEFDRSDPEITWEIMIDEALK